MYDFTLMKVSNDRLFCLQIICNRTAFVEKLCKDVLHGSVQLRNNIAFHFSVIGDDVDVKAPAVHAMKLAWSVPQVFHTIKSSNTRPNILRNFQMKKLQ